ncbi:MAG TPA: NUDIX domain-containing protein [Acidimicrobiales bacterium]
MPLTASALIPGATVVPLRDGPAGLEVLLVQRAAAIAYGGMWAFPGGRVEDDDAHPGRPDDEVERARRTAVREAEEEVGLVFPPDTLVPFSHWTGGAS